MSMGVLGNMTGPTSELFSQEMVPAAWRTILSGAMITALGVSIAAVAYGGGYVILAWGYPVLFLLGMVFSLAAVLIFLAYFRPPHGTMAHHPVANVIENVA
jgi:predicted MFS family arabinose efflux permease